MKTILRSLLLAAALTSTALAQQSGSSARTGTGSDEQPGRGPQGPSGPGRGAPRTPPPEAVAACSGKSAGASCTFQHKNRTETGSCFTADPAQPIACKPVRPPREEGSEVAR